MARANAATELSDDALLAGLALGDEGCAVTFTRRYQRRVFGLALAMTGDPGTAEDVAQEALLRVWRHAPVFDPRRASVATWVLTITRNLAIDALRLRRATPIDPGDFADLGLVATTSGPEEAAMAADGMPSLRAALATLPVEQRRALVLAAVYGRTAAEIGQHEGIPVGTAKTRVRTAMMKVRAAMAERTFGLEDEQ